MNCNPVSLVDPFGTNAELSFAGAVPIFGDVAGGAKLAYKSAKIGAEVTEDARAAGRAGEKWPRK